MGEVETAHTGARPHRKGFGNQHAGILLHIEQLPERTLLRVVRTCRVTRGRPYAAILLFDEVGVAQAFLAAVAPFLAYALVQAFGEGFRQAVGDGFRHDRVVVVVLGTEAVAEFLETNAAGYRESSDVVGQSGFLRRYEINQRAAGLTAFTIGLLTQEVE